jgi:hypothetical protein
MPSVTLLKHVAAWHKRMADPLRLYCVGAGVVIGSAAVRGALGFVNKLSSPPYPQQLFATTEEAEAWCKQQLDAADRR